MEASFKMLKGLLRLTIRLAIIYVIFLGLAWALLGIKPLEGLKTTKQRWDAVTGFVTGSSSMVVDGATGMVSMGKSHLQSARDRLNGKDPYEEYNNRLGR